MIFSFNNILVDLVFYQEKLSWRKCNALIFHFRNLPKSDKMKICDKRENGRSQRVEFIRLFPEYWQVWWKLTITMRIWIVNNCLHIASPSPQGPALNELPCWVSTHNIQRIELFNNKLNLTFNKVVTMDSNFFFSINLSH